MSKSIPQYMAYWQSLMKYGVSRASQEYNKSLMYLHLEDPPGRDAALSGLPGRMPTRPSQPAHSGRTDLGYAPLTPNLGMVELLWNRRQKRGYTRQPTSEQIGIVFYGREEKAHISKPYE